MNLDEAIKYLQTLDYGWPLTEPGGYYEAIKLGIEALIAIQKLRQGTPGLNLAQLPGETKE